MWLRQFLHPIGYRLKWLRKFAIWQAQLPILPTPQANFVRWVNLLTLDADERVEWTYPGTDAKFILNLQDHIQWQMYYYGGYQPHLVRLMRSLLRPDEDFVDLGAHIGQYSLVAASEYRKHQWRNSAVFSFEASPPLFQQLQEHIRINDMGETISAYQAAVSDRDGDTVFHLATYPNTGNGSMADLRGNHPNAQSGETVRVKTMRLDRFMEDNPCMGQHRIGLMKVDIEGAELLALKGADLLITRHRPAIITEAHTIWMSIFGYEFSDLRQFFLSHQYRLYLVRTKAQLVPVTSDILPGRGNDLLCIPNERADTS